MRIGLIFHRAFTSLSLMLAVACQLPNGPSQVQNSDTDFTYLTHGASIRDQESTAGLTPADEYVHVRFAQTNRTYFPNDELKIRNTAGIRAFQKNGCAAGQAAGSSLLLLLDGSLGTRERHTQRLCVSGDTTWFDRLPEMQMEVVVLLPAENIVYEPEIWTLQGNHLVFAQRTNPLQTIELPTAPQPKD
jgi:hypothetical protein